MGFCSNVTFSFYWAFGTMGFPTNGMAPDLMPFQSGYLGRQSGSEMDIGDQSHSGNYTSFLAYIQNTKKGVGQALAAAITATIFLFLAATLTVRPNRSQFFQYESGFLSCGQQENWRVKKNTSVHINQECLSSLHSINESDCIINDLYPSDSGVYWCESAAGECSEAVNITVTGGSVILESPVLPVMEGDNVTLRCTNRMPFFFNVPTEFYKDGHLIRSSSTGNMAIHTVSKSDAGQYKCKIPEAGDSPDSWLTVRDRASDPADPDAPAAPVISVSRIICHLVIATPYVLSTIILGLIYRDKRRAHQVVAEDRRHNVIMELE